MPMGAQQSSAQHTRQSLASIWLQQDVVCSTGAFDAAETDGEGIAHFYGHLPNLTKAIISNNHDVWIKILHLTPSMP
jgi:hypothetical protein